MPSQRFDIGLECRKAVLGAEYVEASLAEADDFNRDFQAMVTEYCWGGTWGRGVLAEGEVCPDEAESARNRPLQAICPTRSGPVRPTSGSWFPETAYSATLGAGFGSHVGKVG